MDQILERVRFCTMCQQEFTYLNRPGRPPAFCDNPATNCKKRARKTTNRWCHCGQPFSVNSKYAPFYCSKTCQEGGSPCARQGCGNPTTTRFCSHECVQIVYPPPYTCRVCKHPFTASEYFLSKTASLNGPPKYCSRECYENRLSPGNISNTPKYRTVVDYNIAMDKITPPVGVYELPLQKTRMPWIGMEPRIPQNKLNIRSQNTIRFWDYALSNFTDDLDPMEYTAFVFEFVCRRSSAHPKAVELQECWTLWPYIEQYLDDRYSPVLFQKFCQNTVHTERAHYQRHGCMAPHRLNFLVMQCQSVFDEVTTNVKPSQRDRKFAEEWLRPLQHKVAPYRNPIAGRENYPGHYSKIQVELARLDNALTDTMTLEMRLGNLEPLTMEQYTKLGELNATIQEFYTKKVFDDKKMTKPLPTKWPWSANCYNALLEAHHDDPLDQVKWEMRTTPKYNLPEEYS